MTRRFFSINKEIEFVEALNNWTIINADGEIMGTINGKTKELFDKIEEGYAYDEICNYFSKKENLSLEYVERNVLKTVQFAIANKLILGGTNNE